MNLHEAANIGANLTAERILILAKASEGLQGENLDKIVFLIENLKEAKTILDTHYPPPLSINVAETISVKDRFGG